MEPVKIYSKPRSNWLLLLACLFFEIISVYLFFNADRVNSPMMAKIISGLLFMLCILFQFYTITKLKRGNLALLIDQKGIVFYPSQHLNYMEWSNIAQIEDLKLPRQRIINIKLINSKMFIENEMNKFLKLRMKFWYKMYDSVVTFNANTLDRNHFEILNILDAFMDDYKKQYLNS